MSGTLPAPLLDTRRHQSLFNPTDFRGHGHRITLLDAGPVGSRLGRHLAELGVSFEVFDDQTVDADFLGAYGKDDWGKPRVTALREILLRDTGIEISAVNRRLKPGDSIGNVVFLSSDRVDERRELLGRPGIESGKFNVVFDVRGDDAAPEIYSLEPRWRWQHRRYLRSLEPEAWATRRGLRIPTVAEYTAGVASLQFTQWFANACALYKGVVPEEPVSDRLELQLRGPGKKVERMRYFSENFRNSGSTVTVIGAGALGSRVSRLLSELGISLELFDFDRVEAHNIPNQAFGLGEIGMFKAEAFSRIAQRDFAVRSSKQLVRPRVEKYDGSQQLGTVVFVCPDNMACRRLVWEKNRLSEQTRLVIEGRMADVWGKAYTAFTRDPSHLLEYGKTLHSDELASDQAPAGEPAAGACRAITSVGPTAECIASRMVWQLIRWFVSDANERRFLDHEVFEHLRPYELFQRNFS